MARIDASNDNNRILLDAILFVVSTYKKYENMKENVCVLRGKFDKIWLPSVISLHLRNMSVVISPLFVTNVDFDTPMVIRLERSKPTNMKKPDNSLENRDVITKNETITIGMIR